LPQPMMPMPTLLIQIPLLVVFDANCVDAVSP
jgi:hypothetical protein